MLPGLEAAPLAVWVAGGAFALVGTMLPLELPIGRSVHFVLVQATFALLLAAGPGAAWVVAGVALIAIPARALAGWWGIAMPASARPGALAASSVGLFAGLAAGHGLHRALGGVYPCRIDDALGLGEVVLVLFTTFVTFVLVKEGVSWRERAARAPSPPDFLERGTEVYALAVIVGAPLQLVGHTLYLLSGPVPWALALGWGLGFHLWVRHEARQARRMRRLVTELSVKERLAALGEISARIAHQMRHQIGLIGMSLHRIESRLDGMPDDAGVVRAELVKLARAQDELRGLLVDGFDAPRGAAAHESVAPSSWADVLHAQLERLEPLAAVRGILLEAHLDAATETGPRDAAKLGEAWFNVLENAIVAAERVVRASAHRDGRMLVLRVEDDGPGMSDEVLSRATEPFFTTKSDGTGLGLAIARAAADEEGGDLVLERLPAGGSRASMRFELHEDHQD